jgi:HAD superfamily hydrolase (TIGR01509 family)
MTGEFLNRYQGAIFDLDGTLFDSMGIWERLCRDWLATRGVPAGDSLERDLEALTLDQAAGYVIRRYGLSLAPGQMLRQWEEAALYRYTHTVPLKAGAAGLVKTLAEQGVKLGIATACFPAACEGVLARHGLRAYFPVIVYAGEVNRDKGFPDLYLAAAERLGIEPKDCIVFEDFPRAAAGVRAAGMGLAAVYEPSFAPDWENFSGQADATVDPQGTFRYNGDPGPPAGALRGYPDARRKGPSR